MLSLSQPPLPIGLRARAIFELRMSDFELDEHSESSGQIRNPKSEIRNFCWYRRRDSNPHCLVSKTSVSFQLDYAGKSKDEGGGMRDERTIPIALFPSFIPHPSSLDWWTWHDS